MQAKIKVQKPGELSHVLALLLIFKYMGSKQIHKPLNISLLPTYCKYTVELKCFTQHNQWTPRLMKAK